MQTLIAFFCASFCIVALAANSDVPAPNVRPSIYAWIGTWSGKGVRFFLSGLCLLLRPFYPASTSGDAPANASANVDPLAYDVDSAIAASLDSYESGQPAADRGASLSPKRSSAGNSSVMKEQDEAYDLALVTDSSRETAELDETRAALRDVADAIKAEREAEDARKTRETEETHAGELLQARWMQALDRNDDPSPASAPEYTVRFVFRDLQTAPLSISCPGTTRVSGLYRRVFWHLKELNNGAAFTGYFRLMDPSASMSNSAEIPLASTLEQAFKGSRRAAVNVESVDDESVVRKLLEQF